MHGNSDAYFEENKQRILSDLKKLISSKSVSHAEEGISQSANFVSEMCLNYGFDDSEVVETDGNPGVVASKFIGSDKSTVMFFGHYDVQSVNEEEWAYKPFKPEISGKDGKQRIYGRGAGDNKGQFFAHLCAMQFLTEQDELDVNVVLLLEGEEEKGSPHLEQVIQKSDKLDDIDLLICADGPRQENNLPCVELGCRGMLYLDLAVSTAEKNLHSGEYGGLRKNAAFEISNLISSLKNQDYSVEVEGFYENVREPTDKDRERVEDIKNRLDTSEELEKKFLEPNLNIAGIKSGYGGSGTETVIPGEATASIGIRMVADQESDEILSKIRKHFKSSVPDGVEFNLEKVGSVEPYTVNRNSEYIEKVRKAVEQANDRKPLLKPVSSASLPFKILSQELDLECIKVPYANHDQNQHAPDENMEIECFRKGIKTTVNLLKAMEK